MYTGLGTASITDTPVLIKKLWMLNSEQVPVWEDIVATPMYYFHTCVIAKSLCVRMLPGAYLRVKGL